LLNPYSLHGRIGRLRYFSWLMVIFLTLTAGFTPVMLFVYWLAGESTISMTAYAILGTLAFLLLSFFSVCSTAQRLHDIGKPTWLTLIGFLPVINWIFSLLLCLIPGDAGENAYGLPPPPDSTAVHTVVFCTIALPFVAMMGYIAVFL